MRLAPTPRPLEGLTDEENDADVSRLLMTPDSDPKSNPHGPSSFHSDDAMDTNHPHYQRDSYHHNTIQPGEKQSYPSTNPKTAPSRQISTTQRRNVASTKASNPSSDFSHNQNDVVYVGQQFNPRKRPHSDVLESEDAVAGASAVDGSDLVHLATPDSTGPLANAPKRARIAGRKSVKREPTTGRATPGTHLSQPSTAYRARSSIPDKLSWPEYARQSILAARCSRLNPYALHPGELQLLRDHITKAQVTAYLHIRNGILRLWHRNPLVFVTKQEAAGCAKDPKYFPLALVCYEWLFRYGYINFGCLEFPNAQQRTDEERSSSPKIIVVGAGMSGLGCARHLEALISFYHDELSEDGKPPVVQILEGRKRIGGRIYSHPLRTHSGLEPGLRSTAEMGAHIITGFEKGNPLSFLIRGQLGLPYHKMNFSDRLYDYDGNMVPPDRDGKVEKLWNVILMRAEELRSPLRTVQTVEGDRQAIDDGREVRDSGPHSGHTLSTLEAIGVDIMTRDGNPVALNEMLAEGSHVGTELVAGRQYQLAGDNFRLPAAKSAKDLGFKLRKGVTELDNIDLHAYAKSEKYPSLGQALDEGTMQYQKLAELTPLDMRLLNWHYANIEYSTATNVNDLNLKTWDQDRGNEFEGNHCQVIGGYTQLPRGLWKLPYPLDVRKNEAVERITVRDVKPGSGVAPISVVTRQNKWYECQKVVLTVPLGVLKAESIFFEPQLPEWKTGAIERMGFGVLNKVVLVYDRVFWPEDLDIFGLLNAPRDKTDSMDQDDYEADRGLGYLLWNCVKTTGRPTLIVLMAGESAKNAEGASHKVLIDVVTNRLKMTFKDVPDEPTEVIVTRWRRDEFARGTYSYVGRHTRPDDYDLMAKPCGDIHFAGEATNAAYPATVHGAYMSGLRAASEVMDSLLGPIKIPQSPLVAKAVRAGVKGEDAEISTAGGKEQPKRKPGYVEVWEPVNKPDPFFANMAAEDDAVEQYEARVATVIFEALGPKPMAPAKSKLNPYIMYCNDEWYRCKAEIDAEKEAQGVKQQAKPGGNEIRSRLGREWKALSAEAKKPYVDKCADGKAKATQAQKDYATVSKEWETKAAEIRKDFMKKNTPPPSLETHRRNKRQTI